jgi:ABC-type multidrug transport system ATPase subunit
VELFCREVAILHRGKVALTGRVKELTAGSGYKLTAAGAPERLLGELRAKAVSFVASNGHFEFQFADRRTLNEAVDRLRAERCEIESIVRSTSTLEQIFVKTIRGQAEEL